MQAKIGRHRRSVAESKKGSGKRPRIKGRSGKQAERLRDWLGEYFIAKYEQTVQYDRVKRIFRYDKQCVCKAGLPDYLLLSALQMGLVTV